MRLYWATSSYVTLTWSCSIQFDLPCVPEKQKGRNHVLGLKNTLENSGQWEAWLSNNMECEFWAGPRWDRPVLLVWQVARAGRHWSLTECLCQSWVPPTRLPLFLHGSAPFLDLALCSLVGAVWQGRFVEPFWLLWVTACFALCHCPGRSCSTLPHTAA